MRGVVRVCLWLCLCVALTRAYAVSLLQDYDERIDRVPVMITMPDGSSLSRDMVVTHYHPPGKGPFPLVILNHGRSATDRAGQGRERMFELASYFVRRGFAVFVPTRVGYGESGADVDPEFAGVCGQRDYRHVNDAAIQEIRATLAFAAAQPWVDATHHIVAGQSAGGLASVVWASTRPAGLTALINFAGGTGGDPLRRPGQPCQGDRLTELYERLGQSTQVPSLWIYTENDLFFGPQFSKEWYGAFAKGGSPSTFRLLPAFGNDGHTLLTRGGYIWRPILDQFLLRFGVQRPATPDMPAASGYAELQDVSRVPLAAEKRDRLYRAFLNSDVPRAFVISEDGYGAWWSGPVDPVGNAMTICAKFTQKPCHPYAIDERVVWQEKKP